MSIVGRYSRNSVGRDRDFPTRKKNESEAVIIEKVDAMSSPSTGDNKILLIIIISIGFINHFKFTCN